MTQVDVARVAGVSPTTVSLVLNEREGTRLSEAVAQRVRDAANQLGYRPNLTARALSTQRSQAIGLVSDGAAVNSETHAMIRGALRAARELRYTLFVAETEGDPDAEREAIEALVDRQVDGIIYALERSREVQTPRFVGETPLVILNGTDSSNTICVLPDETRGGRSVVDLLAGAGHVEQVAVIGADAPDRTHDTTITVQRRLEGIWSGFHEYDIEPITTVPISRWDLHAGYEATRRLIATTPLPMAIVCLNDRLAFGACRALTEVGLRVPEDVSIVSFDDDVIAQYVNPQLTTAALPYDSMGELAIRLLMDSTARGGEHLVPMPMRIRGSVAYPVSARP